MSKQWTWKGVKHTHYADVCSPVLCAKLAPVEIWNVKAWPIATCAVSANRNASSRAFCFLFLAQASEKASGRIRNCLCCSVKIASRIFGLTVIRRTHCFLLDRAKNESSACLISIVSHDTIAPCHVHCLATLFCLLYPSTATVHSDIACVYTLLCAHWLQN